MATRPRDAGADPDGERPSNLLVPDVDPWPVDEGRPIIELEGVTKRFGDVTVLEDLSLSITPGEITVIIGSSGSGKSVLIKLMNSLLLPEEGTVRLFGDSTTELSEPDLVRARKRVGTLFQSYALFDSKNLVENVAFPLVENGVMSRAEASQRAVELLERLELGDALEKFPAELSGGMKKRVSLARSLVTNPEVLLFDEPTTGLDPILMEFVDQMIQSITDDYMLTSVIISHDMASTFRLADSIAVLYGGEIIAHDEPEAIRRTDDDRVAELIRGTRKDDIDFSAAADLELGERAEHAVEVEHLTKSFGDNLVLDDASMVVPKHAISVLIGASGEGKSVLMKHILRLMEPDSGAVRVLGRDLATLSEREMRELRTGVGMLFQHSALFDSMTVEENVAFPLIEQRGLSRAEAMDRVEEMADRLGIAHIREKHPSEISSGQAKRASLARALITEPKLVIYDEPTTGQDPVMSRKVEEMVLEVQEKFDVTSLVISHNMSLTFRLADHVAMLNEGTIIAEGPPAELLRSDDPDVQSFIFASDVGVGVGEDDEVAGG
ncbi:MAG: ABC transporter ATP-binding protein [Bradymonadaceae bacterium]